MKRLIFIFVLAFSAPRGYSQESSEPQHRFNDAAETQFTAAVKKFEDKSFNEAALDFDEIRKIDPVHQRTTAAWLMSAKAHYELKEYAVSEDIAAEFLK